MSRSFKPGGRMLRIIATLSLFINLSSNCTAQSQFWEDFNGPPSFNELYEGANGRIFACVPEYASTPALAGVYFSTDKGENWTKTSVSGDVWEITGNGNLVIVARYTSIGEYEIFQSKNNGDSWEVLRSFTGHIPQSFMVTDSGTIFGYDYGSRKFVKFITRTRRWEELSPQFPNHLIFSISSACLDHTNTMFIGSVALGLFLSRDSAKTWELYLNDRYVQSIAVSPTNVIYAGTSPRNFKTGGAYVSYDTGRSWQSIGLFGRLIKTLVIDTSGVVFASTDVGLFRYSGTPNEWTRVGTGALAFDDVIFSKENTLFATGESSTLHRSTNLGATWKKTPLTRREIVISQFTDPSGNLFIGTSGNGAFLLPHNSVHWKPISQEQLCCDVYTFLLVDTSMIAGTDNGIFRTTDGGTNWNRSASSSLSGSVYSLVKSNTGTLLAGTNIGVFRSIDNGVIWQQVGLFSSSVFSLIQAQNNRLFAAAGWDGIYSSTNDGETWSRSGFADEDIRVLHTTKQGHIFAGGFGAVYRSTNEGSSWGSSAIDTTYVFSLTSKGLHSVFAGTSSGVFTSTNAGSSWTKMNTNGLPNLVTLSLGFDENGSLIAGTYQSGVYRTKQIITGIIEGESKPDEFRLYQNYPNPFNPATKINYQLPVAGHVTLKIYDLLGREVATLVNDIQEAGLKQVDWNARAFPSGVYFYRLQVQPVAGKHSIAYSEIRKMALIK